jgi:hypothetical protein
MQAEKFEENRMKVRLLLCFLVAAFLLPALGAAQQAQMQQMQPLTFWYEYTINPGKEADFMELVKTVGQPVRNKLMDEGVVLAWGMEVDLLRIPGSPTHLIWYSVADYAGVEKVESAMRAQIARLDEEAGRSGMTKKGTKTAGVSERIRDVADISKTRDYLTRDLVFVTASGAPPADLLPWTRFAFVKVKPGKGPEYRKAWDKYNKPIYDKLIADGVILACGLSVEEVRTDGAFTHFTWFATKNLGDMDKVRTAFLADRDRRSQEEQDAMTGLFANLLDLDASRQEVTRSLIFHLPKPK